MLKMIRSYFKKKGDQFYKGINPEATFEEVFRMICTERAIYDYVGIFEGNIFREIFREIDRRYNFQNGTIRAMYNMF